jgi:hypothetical protein
MDLTSSSAASAVSGGSVSTRAGVISAKSAGTFDPNCYSNSNYDACIFWKNPVAQRNQSYSQILRFGTNISGDQVFGVKLQNLINGTTLTSPSLYVYYSGNDINKEYRLPLSGGHFKQAFASDGGDNSMSNTEKSTAQLMAYFWLDYLASELKKRTGVSYSQNSLTYVDAYATDPRYDSSLRDNAFFTYGTDPSDRFIIMGYSSDVQNGQIIKAHEMALSAEVYVHEMGHGNLHAAKGNDPSSYSGDLNGKSYYKITVCGANSTYISDPTKNVGIYSDQAIQALTAACDPNHTGTFDYYTVDVCNSNQGCMSAINEGQADFHYIMVYPEAPALGETVYNSPSGGYDMGPRYSRTLVSGNTYQCAQPAISPVLRRNASLNSNISAEQAYQASTMQLNNCSNELLGEIHGMGTLYASILYEIYTNSQIDARIFEKAFQAHLQKLNSSTNYSAAWAALRADYLAAGGDSAGVQTIDAVFTRRGVNR